MSVRDGCGTSGNLPMSYLTKSAHRELTPQSSRPPTVCGCERIALPKDSGRDGAFWSKVLKTECCWLWTRARFTGTDYGAFWQDGKLLRAHRVAYEDMVGPVPDALHLMHTCDVRHCVRPDHLRAGTRSDNQRDMVAKNRHARQDGEHNFHARFTWETVRTIRRLSARGVPYSHVATLYGTSRAYISQIVNRKTWANDPLETEQRVSA